MFYRLHSLHLGNAWISKIIYILNLLTMLCLIEMVGPISNWSQHPFDFFFNYIFNYIFLGYNGIFSIKWSMENQGKGTLIFIDYIIIHEILNLRLGGKKLVAVLCPNLMLKYQNLKCTQCLQYFRIWVIWELIVPPL